MLPGQGGGGGWVVVEKCVREGGCRKYKGVRSETRRKGEDGEMAEADGGAVGVYVMELHGNADGIKRRQ